MQENDLALHDDKDCMGVSLPLSQKILGCRHLKHLDMRSLWTMHDIWVLDSVIGP